MPPRKPPEIVIPFLEGAEPWRVIDASVPRQLDDISPDERQLISWLTLPLATEVVNRLIVEPMQFDAHDKGIDILRNDYQIGDLDDAVIEARKRKINGTNSGQNTPSFIHIANDPLQEDTVTLLVPKGSSIVKYIFFSLVGELDFYSKKGSVLDDPEMVVRVKEDTFDYKKNKAFADYKLIVPGNPGLTRASVEKSSVLPISRKTGITVPKSSDFWRSDPDR